MAHTKRRMTPLYLLNKEKEELDKLAKNRGVSRQKVLEEILTSGLHDLRLTSDGTKESRREHGRVKTKLQVYFGPTKEIILSGFSVDLSNGGLFLETTYPFEENDELRLIFTLPGQENSISCDARVAWTNQTVGRAVQNITNGVGLEFINLSLKDLMSISTFIENSDIEGDW